uniref:Uncharacterized protein n=1 Tax=Sarcophilus harrisii TaxID=9305 RepID=A0A7N4PRE7_SARHA
MTHHWDYLTILAQESFPQFSFKSINFIQDLINQELRINLQPIKCSKKGRLLTQTLCIENVFNDLSNFPEAMSQLLEHPQELAWINLFFSDLYKIDILSKLHKHGYLTFHGNLIEERKGYRQRMLSIISLSFISLVSPSR